MTRPDPFGPLLGSPHRSAVLVDFDGSLAPIVDDPPSARPLDESLEALERLAATFGLVGVVSGRPVSFLRRRLPVEGLVLVGLYGMERLVEGEVLLDPAVEPYVGRAEQAAADAERALPGLYVERKGSVACVIHWRSALEREEEALALGREVAGRHGLAARPGKRSLELRPPVAVDKGTTVAQLGSGMEAVLFAGDDLGDLDAFAALERMVAEGRIGWAVKVAVWSPEAPEELLERADERVAGPRELAAVLASLADSVEGAPS